MVALDASLWAIFVATKESGMKKLISLALVASATLFSSPVLSHQVDAPGDHTHGVLEYDYTRNRSPQYAAVELRFAPYRPRVDSEFDGATPYADSFGTKPGFSVGAEGSWQALRIPHFGSLGPGVGIHWFRKSGIAEFTSGDPGSVHPNSFWILPMYGVGVLRVDVLAQDLRIPLVPYVKGGLAWALWESRDAGKVSVAADGRKARGLETGYQVQAGVMVHLNPLHPQWAIDMDNSSGVNNAYLFIEWWYSDVDSFGRGMQVGTNTWTAGLALEF